MFALTMYEEYLLDILKGYRNCDVRLYTTNKLGKIGLVKSGTNLLYGYVELNSVSSITYEDYVMWHIGANYSYEQALCTIEINDKAAKKKYNKAYSYNFSNPILLVEPIKIKVINRNGSWIEYDVVENDITKKPMQMFFNF